MFSGTELLIAFVIIVLAVLALVAFARRRPRR